MRSPEQHRTEVHRSATSPATFAARCVCGWEGRTWHLRTHAEDDADEHAIYG